MICLKNRTFAVSQTTKGEITLDELLLWFAWKIVLLQYRKQPRYSAVSTSVCCDLLEKSYFCSIANNRILPCLYLISVVICLKNRTFAVSQTTDFQKTIILPMLWFAWKIVLLQYRKQPLRRAVRVLDGCDLLEKSYFCSIANNCFCETQISLTVVICLKNRTFAVSQTTNVFGGFRANCCDLLEKSYFCSIANNSNP